MYRRATERLGTQFGNIVFRNAIADYFDLQALLKRLRELDAADETRGFIVRKVILNLEAAQDDAGEHPDG